MRCDSIGHGQPAPYPWAGAAREGSLDFFCVSGSKVVFSSFPFFREKMVNPRVLPGPMVRVIRERSVDPEGLGVG